jgi:Zn-dependent membrane protease YugP
MDIVEIETAAGQLADYYHAARKVLRLSSGVASGRSLTALGIAAHEAGHALQYGARFPGLWLRRAIVPLANLCSTTFWMLVLAGLFLGVFRLIIASVFVLWFSVVLQLLNVPGELDASRRARRALAAEGLVTAEEENRIQPVLNARAWTHVAGVLTDLWPIRPLVASSGQAAPFHADG